MIGQVMVDGRHLNGNDQYGDWEILGEIVGWFDSPDRKSQDESRPNADGDFDLPEYYETRRITIDGRLRAKNHDLLHDAENWIKSMLKTTGIMAVSGHGPDQWARVKLAGGIKCRVEPGTDDYLRWQIRLKAPDPRKFGQLRGPDTLLVGGSIGLWHRGNYDAFPVITVTGSFPNGYALNGPDGKKFVVTENPGAGTHTIDMRVGLLRVGSNYWTGHTGDSDVWSVPKAQDVAMSLTAAGATGSATVSLIDTYI